MGCAIVLSPVAAEPLDAHVVRHDQDDVARKGGAEGGQSEEDEGGQGAQNHEGSEAEGESVGEQFAHTEFNPV